MDDGMLTVLPEMSPCEFATYSQILGHKAVKAGNILWNQVRPFFFRPLLPFEEYEPESVSVPRRAILGGVQHAVPEGSTANSVLNIRIFDNPAQYSLSSLDHKRRQQIRIASRSFAIRPIRRLEEFKEKAYPVYSSFYDRTRYRTGAMRRYRFRFARWADAMFRVPKIAILGGYEGDTLRAVSVSMRVEQTLVYASFFCDTESLGRYMPGLMLHSVREMASRQPVLAQIYAGLSSDERGLDEFFALRGCRFVRKSAVLRLNPVVRLLLRWGSPGVYARLDGR